MGTWSKRPYDQLDGRLLEAREERRIIAELTEHVGGAPSTTQTYLMRRLARRIIVTGIVERSVIADGKLGDLQARQLVALWNSVDRALIALGMDSAKSKVPQIADFLGVRQGRPRKTAA